MATPPDDDTGNGLSPALEAFRVALNDAAEELSSLKKENVRLIAEAASLTEELIALRSSQNGAP
jgi:hypothetical protein